MILRWYQQEAIDAIHSYFRTNKGNPIVALPTGTGKSLVIAGFIQKALYHYPPTRVMVLTHVKELIEQNANKLREIWPDAPLGIYSAGLRSRDMHNQIIFGGVASVIKQIANFGSIDLLFIDECHLVSPEEGTMYLAIINALRLINPFLKVVGLSATKFRMGQGVLTEGGLFTDICYDLTTSQGFMRLVAEGFISPPIPKRTNYEIDVSHVGLYKGDFAAGELERAINKEDKNYQAVQEICSLGQERQSWLIFCAGVQHAEDIASMLSAFGVSAAAVHSKMKSSERDARINAFKSGELRAITNNNVLTTGFDHPPIDLIGMLRPTLSTVLWVQMLGRGTRPSPETGKSNCLVLDFARNTVRLGCINDPRIPRPKSGEKGDMPVKICEHCGTYNHTRNKICDGCGAEFQFELAITQNASTIELLSTPTPEVEYFDVITAVYNLHRKVDRKSGQQISPDSIRVSYNCGLRRFDEWVCLEHAGYAGKRAREWWRMRHREEPPNTTAEALTRVGELRTPRRIRVWVNHKPPQVMSYEY